MADSFVDYIRRKRGYGGAVSQQEKEAVATTGYPAFGFTDRSLGSDRGVGYGGGYQSYSGGAGSATAAAAAREARGGIGSDYRSGGGGNYPTSGSSSSGYTGGSAERPGIGSDYVSGGGSYSTGAGTRTGYSSSGRGDFGGSNYVRAGAPLTDYSNRSGLGDFGGNNTVVPALRGSGFSVMPGTDTRQGSSITPRAVDTTSVPGGPLAPRTFSGGALSGGLTRAQSFMGDFGGRDARILDMVDYLDYPGNAVDTYENTSTHAPPPSLGGRYVPRARNSPYAGNTAATGKGAFGSAVHDQFFDSIMRAEGTTTHGYNTTYGNKYMDLENMTINDVLGVQKGMISKSGHSPMGAFQITRDTLIDHGKRVGLDFSKDLFNAENQRKVALSIAATNPSLSKWDGFRKHPDQLTRAKKAYGAIGKLPAVAPGTVAMYRGRQPTAGGIGSDYAASASRGMGSSPGSSYGSGGYKGGTYGGAAGRSITEGVGGAYKNR